MQIFLSADLAWAGPVAKITHTAIQGVDKASEPRNARLGE